MGIRLVIFDLDGTLVDSSRDLADSVNAMLGDLGAPPLPSEAVTAMVGDGAPVLVRRALAASGLPAESAEPLQLFLAHYGRRLTAHTRPYPGIPEVLQSLRDDGQAMAVLTNKPQAATDEILERLALRPWFATALGGDTPVGRKPSPAGLLAIAASLGAEPGETLLVGDSPVDLHTARAAGSRICIARYGFGWHQHPVELEAGELGVDRAEELTERVRILNP